MLFVKMDVVLLNNQSTVLFLLHSYGGPPIDSSLCFPQPASADANERQPTLHGGVWLHQLGNTIPHRGGRVASQQVSHANMLYFSVNDVHVSLTPMKYM